MPIIRDETLQQHDLGGFHYGEIPIEGFPSLESGKNFAYFDGVQWQEAELTGAGEAEVNWDADAKVIEIFVGVTTSRVSATFTADATLA
jgi:hypothetical protein